MLDGTQFETYRRTSIEEMRERLIRSDIEYVRDLVKRKQDGVIYAFFDNISRLRDDTEIKTEYMSLFGPE